MTRKLVYQNVHGFEEVFIVPGNVPGGSEESNLRHHHIPALASTVQKTKLWIKELMEELEWENAQKTYHVLCVVLHTLRDRLTIHETADFASQLPMLLRGMFFEGWQPDRVPVKDRTKEAFLAHVPKAFSDDQDVDPEKLTRAVLRVVAAHVSEGEMKDILAIIPESLRELFPEP